MRDYEIRAALAKLFRKLEVIEAKVSSMPQVQVQVSSRFLPTVNALQTLGSATATQISQVTGRCRAFESKNLNELFALGLVKKTVQGRMKVFEFKTGSFHKKYFLSQIRKIPKIKNCAGNLCVFARFFFGSKSSEL